MSKASAQRPSRSFYRGFITPGHQRRAALVTTTGDCMQKILTTMALISLVFLSGCALERAQEAANAKQSMVGMSKEDVLTCMGSPEAKEHEGRTDVWSYSSGGGSDSVGSAFGQSQFSANRFGNTVTGSGTSTGIGFGRTRARYCTVHVVFKNDVVAAVNYAGRTGGLLDQGEQCAYALQNCVR